jgi:hypothetical protein
MNRCQRCRRWRDCTAPPDWFNYTEIRFCPYQCLWILAHDETLECGQWPIQPGQAESPLGSRQFRAEAAFVKPEVIIAELRSRLAKTGIQGKLLRAQAKAEVTSPDDLEWEAREALWYITGWNRKTINFGAWKRQRRYRGMIIKT